MDDIIEIKPKIGPIVFNVRALLRRLSSRTLSAKTIIVAKRFIQLFEWHGLQITQIQRLFPDITLDKLESPECLIACLTSQRLDEAAELFGVRRSWLDGVDDQIYEYRCCYRAPGQLFQLLKRIGETDDFEVPVRAVCVNRKLNFLSADYQPLVLVLVQPVRLVDDIEIERYYVYTELLDWSHARCRIQIKAMTRVINLWLHRPVPLYSARPELVEKLARGQLVPRQFLQGPFVTDPSLEDYSLSSEESGVAKECAELPDVLDYLEGSRLSSLLI
jgi:hypothetical protein